MKLVSSFSSIACHWQWLRRHIAEKFSNRMMSNLKYPPNQKCEECIASLRLQLLKPLSVCFHYSKNHEYWFSNCTQVKDET